MNILLRIPALTGGLDKTVNRLTVPGIPSEYLLYRAEIVFRADTRPQGGIGVDHAPRPGRNRNAFTSAVEHGSDQAGRRVLACDAEHPGERHQQREDAGRAQDDYQDKGKPLGPLTAREPEDRSQAEDGSGDRQSPQNQAPMVATLKDARIVPTQVLRRHAAESYWEVLDESAPGHAQGVVDHCFRMEYRPRRNFARF